MGQYDRQIQTAKRLIAKFGESCFWKQYNDTAPADATKPWLLQDTGAVSNPANIVFLSRNRQNEAFMQALGKSDIRVGRVYGLMGEVTFVPTLKDCVVRANGDIYKINRIDTLCPNGQNILYTIDFDV